MIEEAAEKLAIDCADWDGNSEPADWLGDLRRAPLWGDGYEIAKYLDERCYVEANSDLVEVCENASSYIYDAHKAAVKQWVKYCEITLALPLGAQVETKRGVGTITRLEPETAEYVVTPADDPRFKSGGGWVIAAEDVSAVAEQVSA